MALELVYTSAPKGLKPGSYGFCTVACSRGLPDQLANVLENLSGYRRVYSYESGQWRKNPPACSYVTIESGGRSTRVLARVADAGVDYSKRTNKIACFFVLNENRDCVTPGPAALFDAPDLFVKEWSETPRWIDAPVVFPNDLPEPTQSLTWRNYVGDPGWAAALASTVLTRRPVLLVVRPDQNVLELFKEAIALLPPARRWDATFATYYTKTPPNVKCLWKAVIAGSPEEAALQSLSSTLAIDLTNPATLPPLNAVLGNSPEELRMLREAREGKPTLSQVPIYQTSQYGARPQQRTSPGEVLSLFTTDDAIPTASSSSGGISGLETPSQAGGVPVPGGNLPSGSRPLNYGRDAIIIEERSIRTKVDKGKKTSLMWCLVGFLLVVCGVLGYFCFALAFAKKVGENPSAPPESIQKNDENKGSSNNEIAPTKDKEVVENNGDNEPSIGGVEEDEKVFDNFNAKKELSNTEKTASSEDKEAAPSEGSNKEASNDNANGEIASADEHSEDGRNQTADPTSASIDDSGEDLTIDNADNVEQDANIDNEQQVVQDVKDDFFPEKLPLEEESVDEKRIAIRLLDGAASSNEFSDFLNNDVVIDVKSVINPNVPTQIQLDASLQDEPVKLSGKDLGFPNEVKAEFVRTSDGTIELRSDVESIKYFKSAVSLKFSNTDEESKKESGFYRLREETLPKVFDNEITRSLIPKRATIANVPDEKKWCVVVQDDKKNPSSEKDLVRLGYYKSSGKDAAFYRLYRFNAEIQFEDMFDSYNYDDLKLYQYVVIRFSLTADSSVHCELLSWIDNGNIEEKRNEVVITPKSDAGDGEEKFKVPGSGKITPNTLESTWSKMSEESDAKKKALKTRAAGDEAGKRIADQRPRDEIYTSVLEKDVAIDNFKMSQVVNGIVESKIDFGVLNLASDVDVVKDVDIARLVNKRNDKNTLDFPILVGTKTNVSLDEQSEPPVESDVNPAE